MKRITKKMLDQAYEPVPPEPKSLFDRIDLLLEYARQKSEERQIANRLIHSANSYPS